MARVKRGFKARRRRNKVLKLAKGFHFDRRRKYKHTAETVKRALHNMYKGRRLLKRDMRRLWIVRINAASKSLGTSYSKFMHSLKVNKIELNRKMLAEIAARDFEGFKAIHEASK
ncbi:MAG: 50S ribosomal protein L20 [Bacteriovoracaceae bacterium]|jgi:large subunit ribosomal protein L20|nr:50S ribosomal protein L20 [Halobacteriovoraceae bacterium]MDP7320451.1 50S ribosomal protein L20 [Bacteriovoracaceae bacterium]|tara:strand:+ start:304 stop:648 length:345 start_codon:yes stop_codon:yes gene_type:complete